MNQLAGDLGRYEIHIVSHIYGLSVYLITFDFWVFSELYFINKARSGIVY